MQIECTFMKWAVKSENYSLGKPTEKDLAAELEQLTETERKLTRTMTQEALQRKVI